MSNTADEKNRAGTPAEGFGAFSIANEIARAKASPQWASGDRFAASVVKHNDFSLTILLLRKGAHLPEHRARGSISVQVLEGSIRFSAAGEDKTLGPTMMCVLKGEMLHAVHALEDSAILLTAVIPA